MNKILGLDGKEIDPANFAKVADDAPQKVEIDEFSLAALKDFVERVQCGEVRSVVIVGLMADNMPIMVGTGANGFHARNARLRGVEIMKSQLEEALYSGMGIYQSAARTTSETASESEVEDNDGESE